VNVKNRIVQIIIISAMALFFFSCTEDDAESGQRNSEGIENSGLEETSSEKPVRTLTLMEEEQDRENEDAETVEKRSGSQVPFHAEKGDRLAEKWLALIVPEDFEIGLLEEESELGLKMHIFFRDFTKGDIDREYIHPDWEDRIMTIFTSPLAKDTIPETVRIGAFVKDKDTISFPIRFMDEMGSSEGIVYLQEHEGQWLITDLQINFRNLTEKKNEGKFQPSMYQWMGE